MISPSVLKVFSLAILAMALKATSERWGASSREIADRQRHRDVSACQRRLRLETLCSEGLWVCDSWQSKFFSNFLCLLGWCVRNKQTYQNTAIWQRRHVVDHNLLEWRTSGRNVQEPIYCHLGEERGTLESESFSWMQFFMLLKFLGRHKVKPYIWNQCTFPEENAFYVAVHVCYVVEHIHGEWVGQSW